MVVLLRRLHHILLVHEVILLRIPRHLILPHRVDLRVAVHIRLVRQALVGVGGGMELPAHPPQRLAEQGMQHLADRVPVALLQLAGARVLYAGVFQHDLHAGHHGGGIIELVPIRLEIQEVQAPGDELSEVLELVRRVLCRIRKESPGHRFQLLGAEPVLIVQQHQHVHDLIVQLQRLGVEDTRFWRRRGRRRHAPHLQRTPVPLS
mmetsp:Transcript_22653/g.53929  ORF Transcript_22653/g.53929 Transcript_22653/m.53929 type:complete len:206 (+) Transcript_22653:694-1311(+)